MKKCKKGNATVVIILVVVVASLVALILSVNTMIKINKDNKENGDNQVVGNKDNVSDTTPSDKEEPNENDNQTSEENSEDETKEPEEVVDPYANYKKITWSTTKQTLNSNITIKIVGETIEITCSGKKSTYDYEEPLKSVCTFVNGGMPEFYVLTEAGVVHEVITDDVYYKIQGTRIVKGLAKYKIIEMTTEAGGVIRVPVYFLTEEGKLITSEGTTYETLNQNLVGIVSFGKQYEIPYDANRYGYHWDEKNNKYVAIVSKSTGAKLSISKLYVADYKVIIVTSYNKLFVYDGESNKAVQVSGDVKSIERRVNGKQTDLVIRLSNGNNVSYEGLEQGYDLKNKKEIKITGLQEFTAYKGFDELTWCEKEYELYAMTISIIDDTYVRLTWGEDVTTYSMNKKLKSTCIWINGGIAEFFVLTEDGEVYQVYDSNEGTSLDKHFKLSSLSKYKIIDITIGDLIPEIYGTNPYFLTSNGMLVDLEGNILKFQ